tara:strand:+ start:2132 stop:2674 length:543 start_codon:yes stop_codon:yes gene_type:complete
MSQRLLDMDKRIKKLRDDIVKIRKTVYKTKWGTRPRELRLYVLGALDNLDLTCLDDRYISRSEMARRTKVAMDKLKDGGRVFTSSIFGWDNVENDWVFPNWEEQDLIDYMRYLYYQDERSASYIAKKMNKSGTLGKRGGKWTSASVLRVIRNEYHIKRNQYEKPEWWGDSHYHVDILMLG